MMSDITEVLLEGMNFLERIRMSRSVSDAATIGFAALLVLGIVNCILGYRLLRFWMMLFGFAIGAGLGFGGAYSTGVTDKFMLAGIAVGAGILLAVIAFLSYKIGIFVLGAGIGLGLGIYILHPTSSLTFFICIIAGIALGVLAIRWAREVLIVGTSLLGGAMAGFSMARLSGLADIPYGLGLSAGFALLGMLIQFAFNRVRPEEEEDEEFLYEEDAVNKGGDYVDPADYIPQRRGARTEQPGLEEDVDEEVFREMLEEDQREGDEFWQKFSRKKKKNKNVISRKKTENKSAKPEQLRKEEEYVKRSKNKRDADA